MPIERREICLTDEELMRAVQAYGRQTPGLLPIGPMLSVRVVVKAPNIPVVTVSIRLAGDSAEPPVDVCLGDESIFELLVRFCLDEGVPMPRGGKKVAQVIDGMLAMVIDHRGRAPGGLP